uniref:BAALC binder of MAP3K1 and KLF4 b n=1 Tax=Amphiprion percula TaxID=161767 RepID=A0A3P8T0Z0_AMPPE
MGCGGSRADAIIEPRYHESWTRETESTWLTNTDVETPLPVATSKNLHPSCCPFQLKNERSVIAGHIAFQIQHPVKQTHPHVPTIHLDLNCTCVNVESLFFETSFSTMCSTVLFLFSVMLYNDTLYIIYHKVL